MEWLQDRLVELVAKNIELTQVTRDGGSIKYMVTNSTASLDAVRDRHEFLQPASSV